MGGQNQWGSGGPDWGAQQQPNQYQQQPQQPAPQQQPAGWGAPPPQQPGGQPPGSGRPKLTGAQIGLIVLAFVLVVGGGAGAAVAVNKAKDNAKTVADPSPSASPKASVKPSPSPSDALPDSTVSPTAPEDSASPSPSGSSSEDPKNYKTAKERGLITVDGKDTGVAAERIRMGGDSAIRTRTKEGTDCDATIYKGASAAYNKIFSKNQCVKYIAASYVSEKRDVYISRIVFQFSDWTHRKAAQDAVKTNEFPTSFLRPASAYDFSKVTAAKNPGVINDKRKASELLVLTQAVFADGRSTVAGSEDFKTLGDWDSLVAADVTVAIGFRDAA